MINTVLPKFIFDEEDLIELKDKGISFQEGHQVIGKQKIACCKFFNITELEIFDELESNHLYEANTEAELNSFASRMVSVMFFRLRQVATIKDHDQKIAATCGLMAAVNALASVNVTYAKRFLPLIRGI